MQLDEIQIGSLRELLRGIKSCYAGSFLCVATKLTEVKRIKKVNLW